MENPFDNISTPAPVVSIHSDRAIDPVPDQLDDYDFDLGPEKTYEIRNFSKLGKIST
jgi:hypothetical protein